MIRFEGVGKTFPTPRGPARVLEGIDLGIPRGSVFGLIGRSGAGKSTLLRLVNRLETPSEGRVTVSGEDVAGFDAAGLTALRRRVGMVFQHFNLMTAKTVAQNVALPLQVAGVSKAEIAPRLADVLARVGLSGRERSYPAQLSGGQKQRVGIARALISRPEVLLCDEATSALDPETTTATLRLLQEINRDLGVTILLVTHEMSVIRALCDRVAVMEAGRIVEQAEVWRIFADPRSAAAKALLEFEDLRLPPEILSRLTPVPTPHCLRVLRLCFQGEAPSRVPEARWLAGKLDRIQGREVGQIVIAVRPDTPLPKTAEVLGYVSADV